MRNRKIGGLLVAALVAATGVLTASPASADTLKWSPCPADVGAGLQCATVSVPLDYRNPTGTRISVAVSKLASKNPARRRGVLVVNPGGPGGSGLGTPLEIAQTAPKNVLDQYDLIGFDPRGVGRSSPITCGLTVDEQLGVLPYPRPGGFSEDVAFARRIAEKCFQRGGSVLPHITTANTARDLERIRIALGERTISYFGISYGTYLGSVYASLFPTRTDRFLFDSASMLDSGWRDAVRSSAPAMELRFPDFAKWAAVRDATYHLGATPDAVRATYFRLAAKQGNAFRFRTRLGLFSDRDFPDLAAFWQSGPSPKQQEQTDDSSIAVTLAIMCGDSAWPTNLGTYQADRDRDGRRYPIAGAMFSNVWACAFWKTPPREPLVPVRPATSKVLILQNQRDPATYYQGAQALRAALGKRARLVMVDQGGHGVYGVTSNACAHDAANAFLAHGTLPRTDQKCPAVSR